MIDRSERSTVILCLTLLVAMALLSLVVAVLLSVGGMAS